MRMTKYLIFGDACTSSDKRTEIYAGFAILYAIERRLGWLALTLAKRSIRRRSRIRKPS
jgi:hypothetical protein